MANNVTTVDLTNHDVYGVNYYIGANHNYIITSIEKITKSNFDKILWGGRAQHIGGWILLQDTNYNAPVINTVKGWDFNNRIEIKIYETKAKKIGHIVCRTYSPSNNRIARGYGHQGGLYYYFKHLGSEHPLNKMDLFSIQFDC